MLFFRVTYSHTRDAGWWDFGLIACHGLFCSTWRIENGRFRIQDAAGQRIAASGRSGPNVGQQPLLLPPGNPMLQRINRCRF
jgi:hypothetical protein